MATNKFATVLHKNTHKITLILIYAILEWILILLLLLNSLLSYLTFKFAEYFGLKPPCLWCSRLDHIIEPSKAKNCYRDLICESHATEVSELGYCSIHKKLAESHDMCEDCSSSRRDTNGDLIGLGGKISFFSWAKQRGMISCDGEKKLRCSCCDVSLDKEFCPSPYLWFNSSWDVLDYTEKGSLYPKTVDDEGNSSDPCKSDCLCEEENCNRGNREENGVSEEHHMLSELHEGVGRKDEDQEEEEKDEEESEENCLNYSLDSSSKNIVSPQDHVVDTIEIAEHEPLLGGNDSSMLDEEGTYFLLQSPDVVCRDDASFEIIPLRLENDSGVYDHRIVPIELIDSTTMKKQIFTTLEHWGHSNVDGMSDSEPSKVKLDEAKEKQDEAGVDNRTTEKKETTVCLFETSTSFCEKTAPLADTVKNEACHTIPESMNVVEKEISPVSVSENDRRVVVVKVCDEVDVAQATQTLSCNGDNVERAEAKVDSSGELAASPGDTLRMSGDELTNYTKDHKPILSVQCQIPNGSSPNNGEGLCIDSDVIVNVTDQGTTQTEITEKICLQPVNEVEDEKTPETPTYVEGLHHHLHKKSLSFERKESVTEESLDGSFISEFENGEGSLTVERLKSAIKAEHKALTALYAELEEERSASAIAANQTMAMITRLQEEKAAMQMEALQYQRMMEEQSEYDQEALQLMNELMVKREKEKQELEKELEAFRKKVLHYEAKERRMMRNRTSIESSRTSSVSSSNVDSDEHDLHHENAEEENLFAHKESSNPKTPADAVLSLENIGLEGLKHLSTLDRSLVDFEDERQSILEQLKALEEKLFSMGDGKEVFEDIRPIEQFSDENANEQNGSYELNSEDVNGLDNGLSHDLDEKHYQERHNIVVNPKRLLPLFDTIGMDNEDEGLNEEHGSNAGFSQSSSVSKFSSNDEKVALEEEVDHVYERLEALEEDREFLKHCIGSLKKGDKGMDILQEILQHLRDLRSVEHRVKNMGDHPAFC